MSVAGVPESTVEFLSPAWFDALATALAGVVSDEPPFSLGQIVRALPGSGDGGEVAYTLRLGGGRAGSLERGTTAGADAVLVATYADARALAAGEVTTGSLIASGRVKIRGDAARLVEAAAALQQAAEAMAGLHRIVT